MMFDATFSSLRFILMHVGRPSVGPMVSKATDYVSLDPLRRNVTPRHGFLIELLPFENEGPVFRQRTEEKGSRRTSLASRVCRTPSFHSLSPIVKLASCSGTIFLSLSLSLILSHSLPLFFSVSIFVHKSRAFTIETTFWNMGINWKAKPSSALGRLREREKFFFQKCHHEIPICFSYSGPFLI